MDIQLSRSFRRKEFDCPCCGLNLVDSRLVRVLQQLRDIVGVIIVTSGTRCKKHNIEVGGHPRSMHLKGIAADCAFPNTTLHAAYHAVMHIPEFKGIGIYPSARFLHLDVRQKKARWAVHEGKAIPFLKALALISKGNST